MPEFGQTISHYRITEKLGQGGIGGLAHDTSLDRNGALKFPPDVFSGDRDRLARFESKARPLSLPNNENRPAGVLFPCEIALLSPKRDDNTNVATLNDEG